MNREWRTCRLAYWIATLVVAGVVASGYQKIVHPDDFAVSVYRFHLLPGMLVNLAAIYLPWLEMVCVLSLLFVPRFRVAALWIVLLLLSIFTVGIAINLFRGTAFGCGCFGQGAKDDPLSWVHVARNLGLIALTVLALFLHGKKTSGMRPPEA